MKTLDFKDLVLKDTCLVCGNNKLVPAGGSSLKCEKRHFNGYEITFGKGNPTLEYVYYYLSPRNKNGEADYIFFSFRLNETLLVTQSYVEFPLYNLDLAKIPEYNYKEFFKNYIVFS